MRTETPPRRMRYVAPARLAGTLPTQDASGFLLHVFRVSPQYHWFPLRCEVCDGLEWRGEVGAAQARPRPGVRGA